MLHAQGQAESQSRYSGSQNRDQAQEKHPQGGKTGFQETHMGFPVLFKQEGLAELPVLIPRTCLSVTACASAENLCELHQEASSLSPCTHKCACICWQLAAQGSLSVCFLCLSLTGLHGPQVVKVKQERRVPRAQVVAPVPASGGVCFLSEYAISVRKAKVVLPEHHCTAKLAALDPLLSVKTWWWTSIILFL